MAAMLTNINQHQWVLLKNMCIIILMVFLTCYKQIIHPVAVVYVSNFYASFPWIGSKSLGFHSFSWQSNIFRFAYEHLVLINA